MKVEVFWHDAAQIGLFVKKLPICYKVMKAEKSANYFCKEGF